MDWEWSLREASEIEVDGGAVGVGVINLQCFGLFACVVGEFEGREGVEVVAVDVLNDVSVLVAFGVCVGE